MAAIFQCTNPLCGKQVSVPEGATQVTCKHCQTLHFTADLRLSESPSSEVSEDFISDYAPDSSEFDLSLLPEADDIDLLYEEQISSEDNLIIPGGEVRTSPNKNVIEPDLENLESQKAVAYLRKENGDYLAVKQGKNVIGRSNADLIISDSTVSRRHCVIEVTGEGQEREFVIYDIGHVEEKPSTNGVYLSGRTLRLQDYERLPLKDGTTLEIGAVQLVFYMENDG